jgi:hypothetical protein
MPDSSIDEALSAARTAPERAAVFGYDFVKLRADARLVSWASAAAVALVLLVIAVPIAYAQFDESVATDDRGWFLVDMRPLGAVFVVLIVSLLATQVTLRLVKNLPPVRQQLVAELIQTLAVAIGLTVVVLLQRAESTALLAILAGAVAIASVQASSSFMIIWAFRTGSKQLPYLVEQHRSLPPEATVLGGRPWRTVEMIVTHAVTVLALPIAVWMHPAFAVPAAALYVVGAMLGTWGSMTGRPRLADAAQRVTPIVLLASALLP